MQCRKRLKRAKSENKMISWDDIVDEYIAIETNKRENMEVIRGKETKVIDVVDECLRTGCCCHTFKTYDDTYVIHRNIFCKTQQ